MLNSMGSDNALLRRVYEAGFAVDEIVLYLDTHPGDRDALNYYSYVVNLLKQAVETYEAQYGPLTSDNVQPQNYWCWINDPWPWEGVCS